MSDIKPSPQEEIEIDQGVIIEDFPHLKIASNEEVINNNRNHNAWIVIGRDRPAGLGSGYGKFTKDQKGDKCTSIHIVVGLDSKDAGKINHTVSDVVGHHIQNDASRIYISQKTDIDNNFLIDKAGTLKPAISRAAIGLKSDNLRFVARESIKLVANSGDLITQNFRSQGNNLDSSIYGIQLITGFKTDPGEVQGIVKSKNLETCLRLMIDSITSLWATFNDYVTKQIQFNAEVSSHTHKGFLNQKKTGTVIVESPSKLQGLNDQLSSHVDKNVFSNVKTNKNSILTKIITEHLQDTSNLYIGSKFNKTN